MVDLDDGREVRYPFASLYALTHAYAASVHKAQGSEFPAVVIPLLLTHAPMLGRTLLYTALRGLLTGAVQYAWPAARDSVGTEPEELEDWDGLLAGAMDA